MDRIGAALAEGSPTAGWGDNQPAIPRIPRPRPATPHSQADEHLRRIRHARQHTARLVNQVADLLARHWPNATMTEAHRMSTALTVAGGDADAARPILRALPFVADEPGLTRAEYALRLRLTTAGVTL
ncbi:hypothetical protein JJV70_15160 [Streptomyces sp. JJ66]|uniref:hypothetical protein n=1 Tax=Streptomyces sp. JJ66 TaxID=2803843 RepID=UPI001C59C08F|nr:hypothetical protein [Streptomyces sp. JJ66]MBW1603418.1 hypothetical protein [Streptomyces sp. JJ66]